MDSAISTEFNHKTYVPIYRQQEIAITDKEDIVDSISKKKTTTTIDTKGAETKSQRKKLDVIMLTKLKKDNTFPQNYRPISFLSSISKMVRRIILGLLEECTEELHILPEA